MDLFPAAIAFFALGANALGTALLLLFNPRSKEVRWFSLFGAVICVWLFAQGMDALDSGDTVWDVVHGISVTALPGTFLASALGDAGVRHERWKWAVLGLTTLVAVLVGNVYGTSAPGWILAALLVWHAFGWLGGSWLISRGAVRKRAASADRPQAARPRLITTLLLFVPVAVVVAMFSGAFDFFHYVLPLMIVGVQLLLFHGVVRHRFYDIDVRAARTGELAAQLATGERLALLGELSATVAHEVRNPLTGIRSLAQRLAEDDVPPEKRRRYAQVVLDEVERLDRVVGNLLGIARRAPAQQAAGITPLAPLFDDLALLVSTQASRKGVALRLDADGVSAAAPREALAQALLNLLLNAIAHSARGGQATLLATRRANEGRDDVVIVVRDSGPGMPKAERARMFEPFVTAGGGGIGLGLSVVRRIVDEHGWRLEIDDAPGGGADMRVTVPASTPARPLAEASG